MEPRQEGPPALQPNRTRFLCFVRWAGRDPGVSCLNMARVLSHSRPAVKIVKIQMTCQEYHPQLQALYGGSGSSQAASGEWPHAGARTGAWWPTVAAADPGWVVSRCVPQGLLTAACEVWAPSHCSDGKTEPWRVSPPKSCSWPCGSGPVTRELTLVPPCLPSGWRRSWQVRCRRGALASPLQP